MTLTVRPWRFFMANESIHESIRLAQEEAKRQEERRQEEIRIAAFHRQQQEQAEAPHEAPPSPAPAWAFAIAWVLGWALIGLMFPPYLFVFWPIDSWGKPPEYLYPLLVAVAALLSLERRSFLAGLNEGFKLMCAVIASGVRGARNRFRPYRRCVMSYDPIKAAQEEEDRRQAWIREQGWYRAQQEAAEAARKAAADAAAQAAAQAAALAAGQRR
jgi:hypothetical protein